eukprot:Seg5310.3 transcript_id=Seg5310.3/GoldUCD/mRNA.D3Y31 product="ATP-dependent DNA helicase hus2/rqh1" protein_id=Seg5310.3/GoldUCD/D3Y31
MADISYEVTVDNAARALRCDKLRDFQRNAAVGILKGHDVLVSQPTGSGKSLIFQLLPFTVVRPIVQNEDTDGLRSFTDEKNQFVLVISPLISLIRDQVNKLRAMGHVCLTLDDEFDSKLYESGKFTFIFTSPEAILNKYCKLLKSEHFQKHLICTVVDEAHCIVKWGSHSRKVDAFRKSYGRISELRSLFVKKRMPFLVLTATATQQVTKAIIKKLELQRLLSFIKSPERTNIRYSLVSVQQNDPVKNLFYLLEEIRTEGCKAGRTLVFCRSKEHVRKLYRSFDNCLKHLFPEPDIKPYEMFMATTEDTIKKHIIDSFGDAEGTVRVLFCTVAFGMGIDCKGLNNIIHYGPPSDVDDYCQETGRAGRSMEASHATLITYPRCTGSKNVTKEMKAYCRNRVKCRREMIFVNFPGERQVVTPMHTCCDICALSCKCDHEKNQCALRGSPKLHQSKLEYYLTESKKELEDTSQSCRDNQTTKTMLDGKQYLFEKLTEFHARHLAKHENCGKVFVGIDIASGWPANSIKKIVDNVESIAEPKDIQKICVIYDDDVLVPIFELIEEATSLYCKTCDTIEVSSDQNDVNQHVACDLSDATDMDSIEFGSDASVASYSSDNFSDKRKRYCATLESDTSNY